MKDVSPTLSNSAMFVGDPWPYGARLGEHLTLSIVLHFTPGSSVSTQRWASSPLLAFLDRTPSCSP